MTEFATYLVVGGINFLVCISTMFILASYSVHYTLYTAAGYALAICCSFFLNLRYTFKKGFSHSKFIKFISFSLFNLILVELIEISLIGFLYFKELYAIITGMIWYTLSGYIVNKFFIYESYEKTYTLRR